MMNCRRTRSLFSEYFDGRLRPGPAARVAAHLAGCSGCREEYERFRKGIRLLKKLKPVAKPRSGRARRV